MTDLSTISELFPTRTDIPTRETNSIEELGSDAFLELMVAQMENQDPTKPIENTEFIGQLAQFGTVSGVQELNDSFAGLSSTLASTQSWQAAALVGRGVVTDSNLGQLEQITGPDGEVQLGLDATVDFQGNVSGGSIFVQDMSGRLVYSSALPSGVAGDLKVQWDGLDNEGNPLPPGSYRVSAETTVNGQSTAIPVYAHQRVESVAIDSTSGQVTLNLGDGGSVAVNQVKQFL